MSRCVQRFASDLVGFISEIGKIRGFASASFFEVFDRILVFRNSDAVILGSELGPTDRLHGCMCMDLMDAWMHGLELQVELSIVCQPGPCPC